MTDMITIREFRPGDEAAFRKLNEEWIRRYFVVETKDEASFDDPQKSILDGGGRIFLAVQGEEPVVVALCWRLRRESLKS